MSARATRAEVRSARPAGIWERSAHWVAPLLVSGVLALATCLMHANCGAALL